MPAFDALTLHTPRLLLRPAEAADVDDLFAIFSDAQAMRYWSTPPWTSPAQASQRIAQDRLAAVDGTQLRLLLQDRAGGAVLGVVSLFNFVAVSERAGIGYILARPAWGRGLAHEALTALLDHAFTTLGLRRIEADVDPRNQRSLACVQRLGFRREGLQRARWVVSGEVSDSVVLGLLASDWATRPGGAQAAATSTEPGLALGLGLGAVRVFVRDIAAARAFYQQALGLALTADGGAHGYCVFRSAGIDVVVEAVADDAPEDDRVLVGRFTGLSFTVPDIAAAYQTLQARGVPFVEPPERQPWGGILATLRDPSGNRLQIVQPPG